MRAYSQDLREKIAAACQQPGRRHYAIAAQFGVSRSFVAKLLRRQRETAAVAAGPRRTTALPGSGRAGLVGGTTRAAARRDVGGVARHLDSRNRPARKCGDRVACVGRAGLAPQKKLARGGAHTERVHELRRHYVEQVAARRDVHRFFFLDEPGLRLDYTRRSGRAPGAQRVRQGVPLQRGRALTLIGVLSVGGLRAVQLLAGALTQRSFAFYVAHCLAPQLRRGDVLVLDNLPVHHLDGLEAELAKRGVEVLFLPPYSPDFSPIEHAWSKLKTTLRRDQARTPEALEQALKTALDGITGDDAKAWFNHGGYHVHQS